MLAAVGAENAAAIVVTINDAPAAERIVFVTSEVFNGKLGGLTGVHGGGHDMSAMGGQSDPGASMDHSGMKMDMPSSLMCTDIKQWHTCN